MAGKVSGLLSAYLVLPSDKKENPVPALGKGFLDQSLRSGPIRLRARR